MIRSFVAILFLALSITSARAQTDAPAPPVQPDASEAAPEKILVVGQRPGPGLWKVSKGEHVLWLFGTYSPLPRKMEWRSQQVETILAQSQEYLLPPGAQAKVGFFRGLTLLPYVIGLKKLPDGRTLKDVLPPEVYARWLPLKEKYLDNKDDFERERPIFAAEALFWSAVYRAGLGNGLEVQAALDKIAKKNKIKVTNPTIELPMDDPAKMIKTFKKSPLDDVACFAQTLERLEGDIDAMRVRANAWAKGDIEAIRKLNFVDQEQACADAMLKADFVQQQAGFQGIKERIREAWLTQAEKSLAANASTFGVLPFKLLLDPAGPLAALEAKGYVVERPE